MEGSTVSSAVDSEKFSKLGNALGEEAKEDVWIGTGVDSARLGATDIARGLGRGFGVVLVIMCVSYLRVVRSPYIAIMNSRSKLNVHESLVHRGLRVRLEYTNARG